MPESLLRQLHQGMAVISADDQAVGRVVEVYHAGLDEATETGSASEEILEEPLAALEEGGAGADESRAYLRVRRGATAPDLFIPLEAVARVAGRTALLRLTRDQVMASGWERQPRLVQLAEERLQRTRP